jgi:RNA-directed DNA polymerase
MLAPQPERTSSPPKPIKILSKSALSLAWKASRDSGAGAGRPGTDNQTALGFSAKLDSNLDDIVRRLRIGQYGFSKLRVVLIPKQNSEKERVICIPTVRDRLVQRAIVEHVSAKRLFPVYNESSFGFIKGLGPQKAIKRALEFRSRYDWCLKTDIQSFFDRIPRPYLKAKVSRFLKGSSLEPLICSVIDCEIKTNSVNRARLRNQGLTPGLGVRQGMPLSPLLANLALADFDREVERRNVHLVRYADDLLLFFRSKDEAEDGRQLVRLLLQIVELTIPEIADGSKTKLVSRSEPLEFLGREIVHLGSANCFVARVSTKQIEKIKVRLKQEFSFEHRVSKGKNFQETAVDLSRSMAAYLGIYRDAFNYPQFDAELRGCGRAVLLAIFKDLFGAECMLSLPPQGKKFLGIEILGPLELNLELDV